MLLGMVVCWNSSSTESWRLYHGHGSVLEWLNYCCLGLNPDWMILRERRGRHVNKQKISPFYRILSPIEAAALLPPIKT